MTEDERQLARERVALWPVEERRYVVGLQPQEVEAVGLLIALLDIRPVEEKEEGGQLAAL